MGQIQGGSGGERQTTRDQIWVGNVRDGHQELRRRARAHIEQGAVMEGSARMSSRRPSPSADGAVGRLAPLERPPWSPWGREYVNTPDRFIWGTRPSALAREAAALTGHRARVIDLGCGEGRDTVFLAEQGHEVIGIDLSIEGLQKAQRLAERRGAHVQWVCAALPDLPVRGSFDLVHSCGSIHYVARTERGTLF